MKMRELDFIRAISIIAVVCIHVTVTAINSSSMSDFSVILSFALNQISRFCVPAFIFVSGVLAYSSFKKNNMKYILKKRTVDLVIPFIVWTTIGIIASRDLSIRNIAYSFFLGYGYFYQMYYIFVLVQFYLFLPLFMKAVSNLKRIITLSIVSLIIIVLFQAYLLVGGQSFKLSILVQNTIFAWILYFVLGLYVGKNYEWFINKIRSLKNSFYFTTVVGSVFLFFVDIYLSKTITHAGLSSQVFNFFRLSVVIYSISMILMLFKLGISYKSKMIDSLFNSSYGIYLNHLVVIFVLSDIFGKYIYANFFSTLITLIIVLVVSHIFNYIFTLLPGIRYLLLGFSRSKKKQV